jgi:hypothetical protein
VVTPDDHPDHGSSAAEPQARGSAVIFFALASVILFLMLGASLRADQRLEAFGLTCVTASALFATPKLLTALATRSGLDGILDHPLAYRYSELTRRRAVGWISTLATLSVIAGAVVTTQTSRATVGLLLVVIGVVLFGFVLLGSMIAIAQGRAAERELKVLSGHRRVLERVLGPDWAWVLAGLLFVAGTLLQFAAAL